MAKAVQVFRQNMLEGDRLVAEQKREQQAKEARAVAVEKLVSAFEVQAGAMTSVLASASTELEATARSMTGSATQTNQQAGEVALAARIASTGVQTVAAAAEELTASVGEISRQISQSTRMTSQAVDDARKTDATVKTLAEASNRIGKVVDLINAIAGQTNLLALNAALETAQAAETVTRSIATVSAVANDTGAAATQVLGSAGDLSRQAERLSGEVVVFLRGVRTA